VGLKLHQAPGLQLRWSHASAAGGSGAQRANSQTPLFSAVLFRSRILDVQPGPRDFPPDWKSYPQERPLQSIMIRAIMLLEIE